MKLLAALVLSALASISAHAQVVSEDHGLVAVDRAGLMWANLVGNQVFFDSLSAAAGSGQAWINELNSTRYGGYSDWALPTGNYAVAPNATTNQLEELFYTDCGNSPGKPTVMSRCGALSNVNHAIVANLTGTQLGAGNTMFMSRTLLDPFPCTALVASSGGCGYAAYSTAFSNITYWTNDSSNRGLVGLVDALAVRHAVQAPELDAGTASAALVLLVGGMLVMRARGPRI